RTAHATTAPVDPADTNGPPRRRASSHPAISPDPGRAAPAPRSVIGTASSACTTSSSPEPPLRRSSRRTSSDRPTRTTGTPCSRRAASAPGTVAAGPWSPPMASSTTGPARFPGAPMSGAPLELGDPPFGASGGGGGQQVPREDRGAAAARHPRPPAEHVVPRPGDLVQDPAVQLVGGADARAGRRRQQPQAVQRAAVVVAGPVRLEGDQLPQRPAGAAGAEVVLGDPETVEVLLRQVDAAAPQVLGDVPQEVRQ